MIDWTKPVTIKVLGAARHDCQVEHVFPLRSGAAIVVWILCGGQHHGTFDQDGNLDCYPMYTAHNVPPPKREYWGNIYRTVHGGIYCEVWGNKEQAHSHRRESVLDTIKVWEEDAE